jgi:hypothetical protein
MFQMAIRRTPISLGSTMKVENLVWMAREPMFLIRSLLGYQLTPGLTLMPWILAFSGSMGHPERARQPLPTPSPGPVRSVASLAPASSIHDKVDCNNPKLIFTTIAYQLGQFSIVLRTKLLQFLSQIPK